MKRIYIAGKYTADTPNGVFDNIREGISASIKILEEGNAIFCPWLDHQLFIHGLKASWQQMYDHSMAWLEVSDEVHVLPGWETSKGTIAEIKRAQELNIPVKYL
jgi:hypothetical protein